MNYHELNTWVVQNIFSFKSFCPENFESLKNKGLFGMLLDKSCGGLGFSFKDFGLIIETLAAIDMNLAVLIAGHNVTSLALKSSLFKKEDFFKSLASGKFLLGVSITESSSGSNPRMITSSVKKQGENYILSGKKYYAGLASLASHLVVLAKEEDEKFIVALIPTNRDGVIIKDKIDTMGLSYIPKHNIEFNDVVLKEEEILFAKAHDLKNIQKIMHLARLSIGFMSIGILRKCLQSMIEHASKRLVQTGLLINNPSVRSMINKTSYYLSGMESLKDIIDFDLPENVPEELVIIFKNYGAELANSSADYLIQIYGGRGFEKESIPSRLFCDSRALRIFEGPTESLNLHLGMLLLRKPIELDIIDKKWMDILKLIKKIFSEDLILEGEYKDYALFSAVGELFSAYVLMSVSKNDAKQFFADIFKQKLAFYDGPTKYYQNVLKPFELKKDLSKKIVVKQGSFCYSQESINFNAYLAIKKIKELGINKKDRIFLYMDKSPLLIALVQGLFKAGLPFMMMTPSEAHDRIEKILVDLNPSLILTTEDNLEFFDSKKTLVLKWQEDVKNVEAIEGTNILPTDPIYYVPTSGTTGIPNIVEVSFSSALKMIEETKKSYDIDENSVIYSFCGLDFDVAISDILTALTFSSCLVLPSKRKPLPDDTLAKELIDNQVTHIQMVPSALKLLPKKDYPHLKHIILGGEKCSMELIKEWLTFDRKIYNAYGPAEATVVSTIYSFKGDEEDVYIGKPLDGKKILIVNENGEEVETGKIGELWIAGWLANGYLNRDDLNNKRFVVHKRLKERMYKTGDLVRIHKNKNLEFIGRIDNQIKFNGIRIEPEEVEKHLKNIPHINEALVSLLVMKDQSKQLVAFIKSDKEINVDEIKNGLSKHLSPSIIPNSFYLTDNFNYSHVGKIDRKNLPKVDTCKVLNDGRDFSFEFSPKEKIVLSIWKRVLGNQDFNPNTNFFLTGGDSLAAVKIANEFRKELNCKVDIDAFFENETIRKQASLI